MPEKSSLFDTWPGKERRSPTLTDPFYLHLRAITDSLARARDRYVTGLVDILDVGCGDQPYYPIFAPVAREYVGADIAPGEGVRFVCTAEELSAPDASFDLVLATQVLEHVEDPHRSLSQMCRVSRPGGLVIFTTHGVWPYHPTPNDYWRWTHQGLEKLMAGIEALELVEVTPHGSTPLALAQLAAFYIERETRYTRWRRPAARLVATVNRAGMAMDRRFPELDCPHTDSLIINYLVVGRRAAS
jgi:SAM-dependent methyltransferase